MEIKRKDNIFRGFFIITFVLSIIDSYSVGSLQKPSLKAAMDSFSKNDYEKAYEEFTTLLQSYPKDPLYKYYSGVCLVKMNSDPEHASSLLQEALNGSLDIKDIPDDALFFLGRSQQMQGRFREAIDSYNSFERKAGKKAARGYDLTTYIQECNAGKGRIPEPEETKIVSYKVAPAANGEVFNLGSDEETTIEDLANRIKELTASGSPVEYIPYDKAYEQGFEDMRRRVPDLSKIREAIGYRPQVSLSELLERVVADFKK